jgi:TolB-like protein/class 3 adenylate cyclase/cytochrome c-type biogenesis protein CcmH/NrfG
MPTEQSSGVKFEVAHVLFIDIVGYSKLLIDEQSEALQDLNQIVRNTEAARAADGPSRIGNPGQLMILPTGDGMALVFTGSVEQPVECALQISQVLRAQPSLPVRMGIHSGPVHHVLDANQRENIAGAGINIAQRVMDCGDAGHILVSKRVADDLAQYRRWQPYLHEVGDVEAKHGVIVSVVNLYADVVGNPAPPAKFKPVAAANQSGSDPAASVRAVSEPKPKPGMPWHELVLAAIVLIASIGGGIFFFRHRAPQQANAAATSASASAPAIPAVPEKSLAVLPFENLSEDKANEFFTNGVQDEILSHLAKVADLKVISRTSVMQYKTGAPRNLREIGQQLGVAHLVEGSVQRAGNKVRVIAQLINARNDAHLWAQTYDRDLADVFAIQTEIAKSIAEQLQAKLSPREKAAIDKPPTNNLAAYDLYLRAQVLFADTSDIIHAKEKLPKAARLLDEAVADDPQFLLGWCLLARVHGQMYWGGFDHSAARRELANAAVETALRLQPDAGEAHLALADYYYHGFRDYAHARTELAIAGRTLPNNAEVFEYTGYIDRREGHWTEATRNLERALELDPRNFFTLQQLALAYHQQRRYADEARTLDRALTIVPGDPSTRITRAQVALHWRGDIKPFQTVLATLIAEDPSVAPDVDDPDHALCERTAGAAARTLTNYPRDGVPGAFGVNTPHAYWEGVVARWQNDPTKAQAAFTAARNEVEKIVQKQPDFAAAVGLLGIIDAGLARKEDALGEGRRACELLPMSKDAIDGVSLAVNLAQIYAWVGEKDLAIKQIDAVERVPNQLSYGLLKLSPIWDSLRGDSRFEKIVASLAPKD